MCGGIQSFSRDLRLSPQCEIFLSPGMLIGVDVVVTGVPTQPVGPIFKIRVREVVLNVGNYQSALRNIPEERRSYIVFENLKL